MSALFFALAQEAKPWIEALDLKPEHQQGHFRFYHNGKHTAVITGPGKLSMAMAVTELAQKVKKYERHPGYRIWNLGISGSANRLNKTGEFFWINKIHDDSIKRDYFPEIIEQIGNFKEASLTTFDRPVSRNRESDPGFFQIIPGEELENLELVDMEASGFFEAASIYFELHEIQVGKVISDHLEGNLCNATQTREWMDHVRIQLQELFESESVLSSKDIFTDSEWKYWSETGKTINFTESMLAELKKSIIYYRLRNPTSEIPLPQIPKLERPFEKKDAKKVFQEWKRSLYA